MAVPSVLALMIGNIVLNVTERSVISAGLIAIDPPQFYNVTPLLYVTCGAAQQKKETSRIHAGLRPAWMRLVSFFCWAAPQVTLTDHTDDEVNRLKYPSVYGILEKMASA